MTGRERKTGSGAQEWLNNQRLGKPGYVIKERLNNQRLGRPCLEDNDPRLAIGFKDDVSATVSKEQRSSTRLGRLGWMRLQSSTKPTRRLMGTG